MLTDPNRPKPPTSRILLYCVLAVAVLVALGYLTTPRLPV